jgi:hypothetical protein
MGADGLVSLAAGRHPMFRLLVDIDQSSSGDTRSWNRKQIRP